MLGTGYVRSVCSHITEADVFKLNPDHVLTKLIEKARDRANTDTTQIRLRNNMCCGQGPYCINKPWTRCHPFHLHSIDSFMAQVPGRICLLTHAHAMLSTWHVASHIQWLGCRNSHNCLCHSRRKQHTTCTVQTKDTKSLFSKIKK